MRGKRQNSHAEEFQITLYRYPTFKGAEHNIPLFRCELYTGSSSKKVQYDKDQGWAVALQWRNLTNMASVRLSKLTSTLISHIISISPSFNVMSMALFPVVFHLQTYNLSLVMRKTQTNPNWETFYKNIHQALLQTVKVIKNKESQKNCHSHEEPK